VGEPPKDHRTLLTIATWHSRVSWVIITGLLLLLLLFSLVTSRWVLAVICIPFLIGYVAAGPGRLRGDTFRRQRR